MKIIFNTNEVLAINSYINSVAKSLAKVDTLMRAFKGDNSQVSGEKKEVTLEDWENSASDARASGVFTEASFGKDGSFSIELNPEFVVGALQATRRVFDKYIDLAITAGMMLKQMFGGLEAEMKNIVEEELGDFKRKVDAEKDILRAKEVEHLVVKIEEAAESGSDQTDIGYIIVNGFGWIRNEWVSVEQAQRLIAAIGSYSCQTGFFSNAMLEKDAAAKLLIDGSIRDWTTLATSVKV